MTSSICRLSLTMAALCGVSALPAETATWITPTNAVDRSFNDTANWVGGVVPDQTAGLDYDFSAEPAVRIDNNGVLCRGQSLEIDRPQYLAQNQDWGRIWGGYGRRIQFTSTTCKPIPTLTLGNPNGFYGTWFFLAPWQVFLGATAEFTPVLQRVYAKGAVNYTVADAGTTGVISNFYGCGLLRKSGAGELVVAESDGQTLNVRRLGGTLTIRGVPRMADAALDAVLATAAFHVDATAADSLDIVDGRITQWRDVRGAGYPHAQVLKQNGFTLPLPWLAPAVQNGLDMVDFGALTNGFQNAIDSGKNAALAWSKDFGWNYSGPFILEAFVVQGFNGPAALKTAPLFGNLWDKTFRRLQGRLLSVDGNAQSANNALPNLNARDGDFAINGLGVTPDEVLATPEVRLFSFRARENAYTRFSAFAADYGAYAGGLKIGEAIFFTNFLTHAERRNVMRHLQKKWNLDWNEGEAENDVGTWEESTGATAFHVPEKARMGVRELVWNAGTLEKTGAGELAVGALYPRTPSAALPAITVSGGRLSFADHVRPSANPQPAADPFRHYDADDARSIVFDATNGVSAWKDQSGDDARTATRLMNTRSGSYPLAAPTYHTSGGPNGRAYLDLGEGAYCTNALEKGGSALLFDANQMTADTSELAEVYLVYRSKPANMACWYIGSYRNVNVDFHPSSVLFRDVYTHTYLQGGEVAIMGLPVDPLATSNTADWRLLRLTPLDKVHGAVFGIDRGGYAGSSYVGGLEYGEVLLYSRRLTRQERVDTEAYLLKKWFNREHPLAAEVTVPSMAYAATADATLAVPQRLAVKRLSVAGDTFTKTGAGTLQVVLIEGAAAALDVREGVLKLADPNDIDIAFRFDASDAEAFTTFVTEAPGATRTNVVSWADVRRNGLTADVVVEHNANTNPTLRTVEMRPGIFRPTVDFGAYDAGSEENDAAGLRFSEGFTNICEVFTVHADRVNTCFIFADKNDYHYHRGKNGSMLHTTYSHTSLRLDGAPIYVNGEPAAWDQSLPLGTFCLVSMAPGDDSVTSVSQMSLDRSGPTMRCGGMCCSEQIGFTAKLTEERRKYWTRHLMHKWFGEGDAPITTNETHAALSLGPAATLELADNNVLAVRSFTGGGKIVGGLVLKDGAAATFTLGEPLRVQGEFVAVGDLDVMVRLGAGKTVYDYPYGEHLLVSATDLTADLSRWSLSVAFGQGRRAALARTPAGLVLRLQPRGAVFTFR